MPAGTRNWGHRDGPRAQAAHQEDGVRRKRSVLQEEEEGLLSRLSDSASRFRGPTGGGSGCVEGSRGQGAGGLGKPERGLKGLMHPVVASLIFSVSVATSSGFTSALV